MNGNSGICACVFSSSIIVQIFIRKMVTRREMKMNKVLISKAEAEALECALEMCGGDRAHISQYHSVEGLWEGSRKALNDLDLETLNVALYVGYEIEPDPEDKLVNYYQMVKNDNHAMGQRVGILNTLDLLNIKIKGINC